MTAQNQSLCVFCLGALDTTTKPEHILLSALGGRKTTRRVICSDCNNRFGATIDSKLAEQVAVIRNLLHMPSGTGNPAPTLRRLKAGDDTIDLSGTGEMRLVKAPFEIGPRDGGVADVRITANSIEELQAMVPNLAGALRMDESEVRRRLAASEVMMISRRPEGLTFNMQFGGEEACRSAAKACLVLWSTCVGNEEVAGDQFEGVRRYVLRGDGEFHANQVRLDTRLMECVEAIQEAYGPLFNLIYVRSNAEGRVVGHFTLYNAIAFRIVLAERGGTPSRSIALVSNPLEPSKWSDKAANLFDIEFSWLDELPDNVDLKRCEDRLSAVLKHHAERELSSAIRKVCDDVFGKYGFEEDQPIPDDLLDTITAELGHRASYLLLGLPYEETLTPEHLKEIFLDDSQSDDDPSE